MTGRQLQLHGQVLANSGGSLSLERLQNRRRLQRERIVQRFELRCSAMLRAYFNCGASSMGFWVEMKFLPAGPLFSPWSH